MSQSEAQIEASFRQALKEHEAGRLNDAERAYRSILAQQPQHAGATLFLGVVHYDRRKFDEAIWLMSRAIELNPLEPTAYNHLGLALLARNELAEAVRQFEKVLSLKPAHLDARINLANALKKLKRFEPAEALFREVIALAPRSVFAHHNLGLLLFERKRFAEAEREFLITLQLAPDFHKTHHLLGQAAENMGHFADAAARYEKVLQLVPEHYPAMSALLGLRSHPLNDALIASAERMAAREDLPEPESYTLCFGLAKRFDSERNYDRAFHYLHLANRRRGRRRQYEPGKVEEIISCYLRIFSRDFIRRVAAHGSESRRPLFVIGMPRTGTTLTEQILAAHPEVFGAGELPDLPEMTSRLATLAAPPYPICLEALSAQEVASVAPQYLEVLSRLDSAAARVVDKNPFNFINVGLIAMLFPQARIVHCQRHPLDVAISCYMELFDLKQDFTTDFVNFAHYYAQYLRLMAHWREVLDTPMFEMQYETLVADPQTAVRRLLDFCGLSWNEACLAFQQTGRAVLTPSKWQVRQPIYASSVGRWRNYHQHIAPLVAALSRHGVNV